MLNIYPILNKLVRFIPVRSPEHIPMFFIIGCPRSGTTILGDILNASKSVCYLHEPRRIWQTGHADTYIWKPGFPGKVVFTQADADPMTVKTIRRLFYSAYLLKTLKPGDFTARKVSSVLLEKLPINIYRLAFIHAIFPEARFIYIYRNGLETARSIEHFLNHPVPYPDWANMITLIRSMADAEILSHCNSHYLNALLCWRMNMQYAVDFLNKLSTESYIQLSYKELVDEPVDTVQRILTFMGIPNDPDCIQFGRENIARRSPALQTGTLSEQEQLVGGPWLANSVAGEERPVNKISIDGSR